ncbi:MAG: hypothetical protein R2851_20000 [Caldilineaceae bacterium]
MTRHTAGSTSPGPPRHATVDAPFLARRWQLLAYEAEMGTAAAQAALARLADAMACWARPTRCAGSKAAWR